MLSVRLKLWKETRWRRRVGDDEVDESIFAVREVEAKDLELEEG